MVIPVFIGESEENKNGGEKGIRTPERVNPLTVFETAAFDHSAISPNLFLKIVNLSKITYFPSFSSLSCVFYGILLFAFPQIQKAEGKAWRLLGFC